MGILLQHGYANWLNVVFHLQYRCVFFSWNRYHFPIGLDHQKTKKTPGLGAAAVRLLHNTFPLPPLPAPKKGYRVNSCLQVQPSSNPCKVCRWGGMTG